MNSAGQLYIQIDKSSGGYYVVMGDVSGEVVPLLGGVHFWGGILSADYVVADAPKGLEILDKPENYFGSTVATVEPGTRMQVIGQEKVDGLTIFWPVRLSGGIEGWVADNGVERINKWNSQSNSTLTPTPAAGTPSNTDPTIHRVRPDQFIQDYYTKINNRQYEQTWALLSSGFKDRNNSSAQGGYQGYVSYWNSMASVQLINPSILTWETNSATVSITLHFNYTSDKIEDHSILFELVPDNADGWLIDATSFK